MLPKLRLALPSCSSQGLQLLGHGANSRKVFCEFLERGEKLPKSRTALVFSYERFWFRYADELDAWHDGLKVEDGRNNLSPSLYRSTEACRADASSGQSPRKSTLLSRLNLRVKSSLFLLEKGGSCWLRTAGQKTKKNRTGTKDVSPIRSPSA